MFKPFEVIKRFCSCYDIEAAKIDEKNKHEKIENTVALVDMKTPSEDGSIPQREQERYYDELRSASNEVGGQTRTEVSLVERGGPGLGGASNGSSGEPSMVCVQERRTLAPDKVGMLECLLPFKCDTKPTLVLDLDQTLVYSTFEMPRCYDFNIRIPGSPSAVIYVKLRPHIAKFIETIGLSYEIVVFTAAKKEYAQKVISEIDKNGHINHILYRESCTLFNGKYIKDLSKLGRPLRNVILVDDIPYSYKLQPRNGVHIPPYTGEESDDALLELMRFLRGLPKEEDLFDHIVQAPFKANITG